MKTQERVLEVLVLTEGAAWYGPRPSQFGMGVYAIQNVNMVLKNTALLLMNPAAPKFEDPETCNLVSRIGLPVFRLETLRQVFMRIGHEELVERFGEVFADFVSSELIAETNIVRDLDGRKQNVLNCYDQWLPKFNVAWLQN